MYMHMYKVVSTFHDEILTFLYLNASAECTNTQGLMCTESLMPQGMSVLSAIRGSLTTSVKRTRKLYEPQRTCKCLFMFV